MGGGTRTDRQPPRVKDAAKRLVACVPPALVRSVRPARLREPLRWWLQASLERWPRSFVTRTPEGFLFAGSTEDIIQRFVHVYGVWEPELTRWARSFLRSGDVALDVGANSGYHTLLFVSRVGPDGRVIAVEPVPSIFAQLEENLRLNDCGNVHAELAAAGAAPGTVEIFRSDAANLGWSGTAPTPGSHSEGEVPRRTLAELVSDEDASRLRLVKIDTEGDEHGVVSGLVPLLPRMPRDAALVVEVTPAKLAERGESAEGLLGLLARHGFEPFLLGEPLEPLRELPGEQADVVFLRRSS